MKYADYIERKRHGSPEFPIQYYNVDRRHPQYIMVPHWHKEFEWIRVIDGTFTVNLNGVEHRLMPGQIFPVAPGCLHGGEPQACHYECIVLDLNMLRRGRKDGLERYFAPLIGGQVALSDAHLTGKAADVGRELFEVMRERKADYELQVYGLLFSLFFEMYIQGNVTASVHDPQPRTVTALLDWIEENFAEPITLEMLSQKAGLSRKYLCRIFKEYTGKTVIDYLNELRIDNACHEIAVKGLPITQAAYDSGFNDLSYFCKVFKRYKGVTPRAYKKTES